jgi:hypothetical protein
MLVEVEKYDAWKYVEVYRVVEWKDGLIYRTKSVGYAKAERPREPDEVYASVSTRLTQGTGKMVLDPFIGSD